MTCGGCDGGERDVTRPLIPLQYVFLCKVRLVGAWIKRVVVFGAWRTRSKKLREHQYIEGYARSLGGKGVEWDG